MKGAGRRWTKGRRLVIALQVAVLVVWLGGWELAARTRLVDPFFFSQPSAVWAQIVTWTTQGTSQGSLGEQILVTLEEATMGFVQRIFYYHVPTAWLCRFDAGSLPTYSGNAAGKVGAATATRRCEPRRIPTNEATPPKVATRKETKSVRFPNAAMGSSDA